MYVSVCIYIYRYILLSPAHVQPLCSATRRIPPRRECGKRNSAGGRNSRNPHTGYRGRRRSFLNSH